MSSCAADLKLQLSSVPLPQPLASPFRVSEGFAEPAFQGEKYLKFESLACKG